MKEEEYIKIVNQEEIAPSLSSNNPYLPKSQSKFRKNLFKKYSSNSKSFLISSINNNQKKFIYFLLFSFLSLFLIILFLLYYLISLREINAKIDLSSKSFYFNNTLDISSKKIIACIFATDTSYFSITMKYLNHLKLLKKISEIHIWQFSPRDSTMEATKLYRSFSNIHKTAPNKDLNKKRFRQIFPQLYDENRKFDIFIKGKEDAKILINNQLLIEIGLYNNTVTSIRKFDFDEGNNTKTIFYLDKVLKESIIEETVYTFFTIEVQNNKNLLLYKNNKTLLNATFNYEDKSRFNISKIQNEDFYLKENNGTLNIKTINEIRISSGEEFEVFWEYKETKNFGYKLYESNDLYNNDTNFTMKSNMYPNEVMPFYLDYDFDVFIKLDNDIIFMEVDKFDEYVNFIINDKNSTFVFPMIINHPVGLFYQIKLGFLPRKMFPYYYLDKTYSNEIYDYIRNSSLGSEVHEYFLDNMDTFIKKKNNYYWGINLEGELIDCVMYGIRKDLYNKFFDREIFFGNKGIKIMTKRFRMEMPNFYNTDDYIFNQMGVVMFPRFTVAKFALEGQKEMKETVYLKYNLLAKTNKKLKVDFES